jgi:hypothetical protein
LFSVFRCWSFKKKIAKIDQRRGFYGEIENFGETFQIWKKLEEISKN